MADVPDDVFRDVHDIWQVQLPQARRPPSCDRLQVVHLQHHEHTCAKGPAYGQLRMAAGIVRLGGHGSQRTHSMRRRERMKRSATELVNTACWTESMVLQGHMAAYAVASHIDQHAIRMIKMTRKE